MLNKEIKLEDFKLQYGSSDEIKFVIIDNLFEIDFIKKCEREFLDMGDLDFIHYQNPLFEFKKFALNDRTKMPENLKKLFEFIHSPEFVEKISEITSFPGLMIDEERWGGGLHMTKKGGYLSVHKDFNILPTSYLEEKQMLRCINLIGYLNSRWTEGDGGDLEFWNKSGDQVVERVSPKFNRWVLFDTRDNYHGHPYPYKGESPRISIASYYYIKTEISDSVWASTEYLKLPWMEESEEYKKARKERADAKSRYSNLLKKRSE
jgi:hypothetical protein